MTNVLSQIFTIFHVRPVLVNLSVTKTICFLLTYFSASNSSSDGDSTTEDSRPAVSFDDIMGSTYRYNSLYPDWDESSGKCITGLHLIRLCFN